MRGFLADLYLRPSCYACPAKSLKSGSDITIGDFWGIQRVMPEMDDDRGTSLVMINSEKGSELYSAFSIEERETTYQSTLTFNPAIEKSPKTPLKRLLFYQYYNEQKYMIDTIRCLTQLSLKKRLIELTKQIITMMGLKSVFIKMYKR